MSVNKSRIIIAYNFQHPEKSVILHRNIIGSLEETLSKTDVAAFAGQGIWICESRIIESIDEAEDLSGEIYYEGKLTAFEINSIVQSFPLIEGEISAGIYRFYQSEPDYYEIKDALALSKLFNEEPNFDSENEKFVCSSRGISLHSIKDGAPPHFYEKHPFSFFDVCCPLCRTKVMTYETDSESFQCRVLALSCPHFVGQAVWSSAGYESAALRDLKVNHKLIGENLYFETITGWQKPVIYTPPPDSQNSFWNGSHHESKYISHFFFLESEPKFWIK